MAGYSPVNNILVLKGDTSKLALVYTDPAVINKLISVCTEGNPFFLKDIDKAVDDNKCLWIYYETNGEPHEEVPEFIKEQYPSIRVFFSSIDYDEWCFAYYKEFGMDGIDPEYNYGTRNDEKIEKIFENFVEK